MSTHREADAWGLGQRGKLSEEDLDLGDRGSSEGEAAVRSGESHWGKPGP